MINKIWNENCLDTMARMPDNFIDLSVTSPPYDNLREYKGYSFDFENVAKELFRVTKKGGVVVWVVDDMKVDGCETGTTMRQALHFMDIGFNLHDKMIYEALNGAMGGENEYLQCWEFMFVFSKGKPKTVNLLRDRKNVVHGDKSTPKRGRNKNGDLTERHIVERAEFGRRKNIWQYPVGGSQEVGSHPAIFPEKLAADHIYSWSNEGDLVYDPFMGSGTTAKMSHIYKRNWIGSEISKEYCEIAEKRIKPYLQQATIF